MAHIYSTDGNLNGPVDGVMFKNGHAIVADGLVESFTDQGFHTADPLHRPQVGGVPLVGGAEVVEPEPAPKKAAAKKASTTEK